MYYLFNRDISQNESKVEAASGGVLYKKLFLKISQYSQEKTYIGVSLFNKVAGFQACTFIKKRLYHRCFLVNITKFLRMPTWKNICEWLLLGNAGASCSVNTPEFFFFFLFHKNGVIN